LDWQVWIQDGAQPVPRKIVITYKAMPGQPQFVAYLGHWDLSAKNPESVFEFTPPPGCKRIELKPAQGALTPNKRSPGSTGADKAE
jgi:hypothetical protein